jgi:DNA-binding Lrp family transcriptional regulator
VGGNAFGRFSSKQPIASLRAAVYDLLTGVCFMPKLRPSKQDFSTFTNETLDKFDLAILNQPNDGRLTNAELASRVGLSAAPCWRRVRALEESGFITGYRAELNRDKIGLGVLAFVRLDAERNSGDVTRQLEAAIQKIPEIVSCHYISGSGTFELQVVCPDLGEFSRFAREVLINLPNVKDLHTSFSLGEVKSASALPLGHLLTKSLSTAGASKT